MKLFHSPGSCSLGIHVILEELGVPYEDEVVNLREGAQFSPDFRALNPKGKVPALVRDDGTLLTEFQTIAVWLGRAFPGAGLMPESLEGQARVQEALDFIVGTVHMRGVTFVLTTRKFLDDETAQEALREHGRKIVRAGYQRLSDTMGDRAYLLGDVSVADAALFYVTRWAPRIPAELPENLRAFHARMLARPAVARTVAAEGL